VRWHVRASQITAPSPNPGASQDVPFHAIHYGMTTDHTSSLLLIFLLSFNLLTSVCPSKHSIVSVHEFKIFFFMILVGTLVSRLLDTADKIAVVRQTMEIYSEDSADPFDRCTHSSNT
jgi:hypothetical protein